MHYKAMGDLGYTGSLSDRIHAFLTFKYGSFYEAMRDLRNGTSIFSLISAYAVNNFDPSLVFDFEQNYYRTGGEDSTLSSSVTHAATSNATMTGSDGNIKWRPHNLFSYSEQFDNAAWAKYSVSVTANADNAPDETQTADSITPTTADAYHGIIQNVTLGQNKSTYSVYLKPNGYNYAAVGSSHGPGGSKKTVKFNLTGVGSIISQVSFFTDASITSVGNGWYLCSVTFVSLFTTPRGCMVEPQPTSTYASSFAGDGTSGVYAWGAHAYRSDLGGMVNNPTTASSYVPTTSSAAYLPRVGHHIYNGSAWVNEGILHESEARTNLVTYSIPTVAAWATSGPTITENAAVSPDGSTNATRATGSGSNSAQYISENAPQTNGIVHTCSVYFKTETAAFLQFVTSKPANSYVNVNASTLVLGTVGAGASNAIVTDVGNGWARLSFSYTPDNSSNVFTAGIITSATASRLESNPLSTSALFYGYQSEVGSTPSSYIPTSGSTVTRAAETLTVPAANMPWPTVVEVTGTELASQVFADWTATASTLTDNGNGTWNLTDSDGGIGYINDQLTGLTVGNVYQVTSTVTNNTTSGSLTLQVGTSVGGSQIASAFINADTNGTITFQFAASATTHFLGFRASAFVAGDGFDFTPISVKEINPLALSIQMDGRMTYADDGSGLSFFSWYKDAATSLGSGMATVGARTGELDFRQEAGNVLDFVRSSASYHSPGINVPFNLASRHGSTFLNGAADGTALTADTTPTALPDLSASDLTLGSTFMGTIGKFRVWSDDLTDTGIEEAST